MRKPLVYYLVVSFLILSSCSQQPPELQTSSQASSEPTLTVKASVGKVRLNQSFPVTITITGVEPESDLEVSLEGVAGISTSTDFTQLSADTKGRASLRVNATVSTRNHSSLIVSTEVAGHPLSATLDLVFDSKGTRAIAKKVGATASEGKAIDILTYYDALPRTSDPNYVLAYEREKYGLNNEHSINTASVDSFEGAPDTLIVDEITYLLPDGSMSEPFSGIEYYLADTGGGTPMPDDIEGVTEAGGAITTQTSCGTVRTSTRFVQSIDGVEQPLPINTYVRAVDYNGIWADRIIEEWFIGANGYFWYDLPLCDTAGGSSKPDVYFIFETRTQKNVNGTSVADGLTASHGTLARRHWWRTGTYYDITQTSRPSKVTVVGTNAEAKNTQRLWYKVNQVRNWEREATGVSFPADVLYPVAAYAGVFGFYSADQSRAALGQIQIVYAQALRDDIIFHEYGHLAYYRKVMGASAYNAAHSCNLSATCVSFPTCGGCIGHNFSTDIGPEAAMIEGYADFFEAITTRNIPGASFGWSAEAPQSNYPVGLGSEGRVGNFLWDLWDTSANIDPVYPDTDNDPVKPSGSAKARYKTIANYFLDGALSWEFKRFWNDNIKTELSGQTLLDHCIVLRFNTLGAADPLCP